MHWKFISFKNRFRLVFVSKMKNRGSKDHIGLKSRNQIDTEVWNRSNRILTDLAVSGCSCYFPSLVLSPFRFVTIFLVRFLYSFLPHLVQKRICRDNFAECSLLSDTRVRACLVGWLWRWLLLYHVVENLFSSHSWCRCSLSRRTDRWIKMTRRIRWKGGNIIRNQLTRRG